MLLVSKLYPLMLCFCIKVYLSGTNTAWISYGYDFGNNAWADHGDQWIAELDRVLTNLKFNLSQNDVGQNWMKYR